MLLPFIFLIATPTKIAMPPLTVGEGVTDKAVATMGEAVASELRRLPDLKLLTQDEMKAVLTNAEQQQMLGCSTDVCFASLGSQMGVDRLLLGSVSKLGESYLVFLKLIDVKTVAAVAQVDRRLRKAQIDDVLDALPSMVAELFGQAPAKVAPTPAASVVANTPSGLPKGPPAGVDKLYTVADAKAHLQYYADSTGHFIAADLSHGLDGPLFAGNDKQLFQQRITSGGRSGDQEFNFTFWDPRITGGGWKHGFSFKEGKGTLQCGDHAIVFSPSKANGAKLYQVRWQRRAVGIAMDDNGIYYYVDQALAPEVNDDYHLFVGKKGQLRFVTVDDAVRSDKALMLMTPAGKLKLLREVDKEGKEKSEWQNGSLTQPLNTLELDTQAPAIYTKLGVYKDDKLGTACDDLL